MGSIVRPVRQRLLVSALLVVLSRGAFAQASTPAPGSSCDGAAGRVLMVGPGQPYPAPSAAAATTRPGDVIKIAAGDYRGDVAVWQSSNLTICGVGGRPRLFADGKSAQEKAIWVIGGTDVTVDNIEFRDAKVPDENGAGIRFEGGNLTVRNSAFFDNEGGILSGNNGGDIVIERSEFGRNGHGDDQSHNIYIGRSNRLIVMNSFFHGAKSGHNLKSRAKETRIENSYFMDGLTGNSSYLADFPNGGVVYLRGNLFHKGPKAENWVAISFGAEGLKWSINTLELVHNTVVMTRPGGYFLKAPAATQLVSLTANLFAGTNNAGLIVGGRSVSDPTPVVKQRDNHLTSAEHFRRAVSIASPNFWPSPALLARIGLEGVPDSGYVSDAPQPLASRRIATGARRLIGALQTAP